MGLGNNNFYNDIDNTFDLIVKLKTKVDFTIFRDNWQKKNLDRKLSVNCQLWVFP